MEKVERVQGGLLENMFCKGRLRELGVFSLVKRQPRRNPIAACSYLKGSYKDSRTRLFSVLPGDIARGNSHILQLAEFKLGIINWVLQIGYY